LSTFKLPEMPHSLFDLFDGVVEGAHVDLGIDERLSECVSTSKALG
jgi:hypothetical protein